MPSTSSTPEHCPKAHLGTDYEGIKELIHAQGFQQGPEAQVEIGDHSQLGPCSKQPPSHPCTRPAGQLSMQSPELGLA